MKYILALLLSAAALLLPGGITDAELSDPLLSQRMQGVYMNIQNVKDPDRAIAMLKDLKKRGFSTVVFDVKDTHVYFEPVHKGIAREANVVLPLYDLRAFVIEARRQGIYTIARYVAVKDFSLGEGIPETRLQNPVTHEPLDTEWVDPSNETVLEYNRQLITEVALAGVDEINLDYIRYPSDNVTALSQIKTTEKAAHLEEFLRMAREAIDTVGYDTKLGISTYAIVGWYFESSIKNIAQDVVRFAPYVDIISPMAYPSTFAVGAYFDPAIHPRSRMYYLVKHTLDEYKELLGPEHAWKLRPWIQGYSASPYEITEEMDAVYAAGFCGFTVWSVGNYYDSLYTAFRNWHTPLPEHCKTHL